MWQETKNGLYKRFQFEDFKAAFAFMEKIAEVAEKRRHHPRWANEWNVLEIWLRTHNAGGQITSKDRELAQLIDQLDGGKILHTPQIMSTQDSIQPKKLVEEKIILYADGGSRGNPGPSASGYVLLDENENILVDNGVYLGITTNNQAEYQALRFALEDANRIGAREVFVHMDSLLVINQMKGIFKVRNRDLWPIHDAIQQLVKEFKHVSFTHVPRELNKLADAAVNRVLDETLKSK